VDIVSYDWPNDVPDMDAENAAAISTYDIVVSSNSWGWGLCPDYCAYYVSLDCSCNTHYSCGPHVWSTA